MSEGAVSRWIKRGREGGVEALEAHPPKGVSPRLTGQQKAQIPELLAKGAQAYGFNPDEGIWNYLKRVELGNVCCGDLDQLHQELIRASERLRHKKEIIKSCSRQCGYLL